MGLVFGELILGIDSLEWLQGGESCQPPIKFEGENMNTPSGRLSTNQFNQVISDHIKENYKQNDTGGMDCIKCGSEIQQTTCVVSIHDKRFSGCVGGGEVKTVPLPYCPKCEGVPQNVSTCIHV